MRRKHFAKTADVVAAMQSRDSHARPAAIAREGPRVVVETDQGGSWSMRRWDSAKTTRLNEAHWTGATDTPINEDLSGWLGNLRARCMFEAANNPLIAGVIFTHAVDIVGHSGPTLQVDSNDNEYNRALETAWRNWFDMPDAGGTRSGVDLLRQWTSALWTSGEFVEQFTTGPPDEGPVTLRLLAIAPRRLRTPINRTAAPNIVLGVERDRNGRPLAYHVERVRRIGDFVTETGFCRRWPASRMLHGFMANEADQARGVPWLASSLQTIADLRDYDAQVLDAARQAAATGVYLYTKHPDAPYLQVNEEVEMQRNTQSTMPPGWEPFQLTPGQPSAQYVDFRRERHIEIGRPAAMPLLAVRADASKSNFSSARFDGQSYQRANAVVQGWLSKYLRRLTREVERELMLAARARDPRVPAVLAVPPATRRFRFSGWPVRPHVDPQKERRGTKIGLDSLTLSLSKALAAEGYEFTETVEEIQRELQELASREIAPGMTLLDLYLLGRGDPNAGAQATIVDGDEPEAALQTEGAGA